MRTVQGTAAAWIIEYCPITPQDLKSGDGDKLVQNILLSRPNQKMEQHGWVRIGDAQITLTIREANEIVGGQVEALKAQKQKVIADAEVEANKIEQRIQSLLAITA